MFSEIITPRFGDTDACGHINNAVLPVWFEHARNPVLRIMNPSMDYKTWNTIVAHIEVDFVSQLHLDKEVEIKTYISKIGNSSFEIYNEAWQNGVLGAKGKAVLIHYDFTQQKSVPLPEDIKGKFKEHWIDLYK
ncbi:MAG: thioesterase [Pseudopedobacter saltans]|uniref:Thioesterase n=1 Tax=Pseudopedobacter saltans TaxID=151895 RepID=A0A2W5F9F0_9SPHI|nr:MAG: thioesterase [Pseudopedobacter saltans]